MSNRVKKEYDQNGNLIWSENNKGGWEQREYDPITDELVFWENQDGVLYSLNEARLNKPIVNRYSFNDLKNDLTKLDGTTNPKDVSGLIGYEFKIMGRKYIQIEYGEGQYGDYMIYEDPEDPYLWFEITYQSITKQRGVVIKPFEFIKLTLSDELEEIIEKSNLNEARLKKPLRKYHNLRVSFTIEASSVDEEYQDIYSEIYHVLSDNVNYIEIHDILNGYVMYGIASDFQTIDFEIGEDTIYRVWFDVEIYDKEISDYLDEDEPRNLGVFGSVDDAKRYINYIVTDVLPKQEAIELKPISY